MARETVIEIDDGKGPDEALASVERLRRELGPRRADLASDRGGSHSGGGGPSQVITSGTSRWMADF